MTTLTPYPAIVFDLDGTLLDTWPSLLQAVRATAPAGAAPLDPAALRRELSAGIGPMFALAAVQMAPRAGAAHHDAQVRLTARHYIDHTLSAASPYAHAGDLLARLHRDGHALALCTNRDRASTLTLLDRLAWRPRFAHIHCLDDGLPPKPDATPLLHVLSRIGCAPGEALFVGDSRVDAQCAAAANVAFAAHTGGYHAHPHDLQPAVLSYSDARELAQWIAAPSASVLETEDD